MHVALWAFAVLIGLVTTRASVVMGRGGVQPDAFPLAFLAFLSMLATFGNIVLGFFLYAWWIPLVVFVGAALLVGGLVTRSNVGAFYQATPLSGAINVGLCIYGWYQWAVA